MGKRILFLTNDFPPLLGGAGNLQYNVVTHFTSPVLVVVLGPHKDDAFDQAQPFRIVRYHLASGKLWMPKLRGLVRLVANAGHLLPWVWSFRPTEIHIGYPNLDHLRFAFWLRAFVRIPYIVYTYGKDVLQARGASLRYLRAADKVYTISAYTRGLLVTRGVPEPSIVLIWPSIDEAYLSIYSPGYRPTRDVRAELAIGDAFVLLTVGRLEPRKGHHQVLYALAQIGQRLGNWAYLIAGEGPQKAVLQQMVQELGMAQRVYFLGAVSQSDLFSLYYQCDVFIMPNGQVGDHVEGFGLVFLEANAAGKPVIGGRSGGAVDAIEDGQTGLLVDPEDGDDIARAILRLYEDRELRLRIGRYGRQRVETLPRWAEIAHRLETAIEST